MSDFLQSHDGSLPGSFVHGILQASLHQYVNSEIPDIQAGFRKGRGTRDQIANIFWIMEKGRVPEKHLSSVQSLSHVLLFVTP